MQQTPNLIIDEDLARSVMSFWNLPENTQLHTLLSLPPGGVKGLLDEALGRVKFHLVTCVSKDSLKHFNQCQKIVNYCFVRLRQFRNNTATLLKHPLVLGQFSNDDIELVKVMNEESATVVDEEHEYAMKLKNEAPCYTVDMEEEKESPPQSPPLIPSDDEEPSSYGMVEVPDTPQFGVEEEEKSTAEPQTPLLPPNEIDENTHDLYWKDVIAQDRDILLEDLEQLIPEEGEETQEELEKPLTAAEQVWLSYMLEVFYHERSHFQNCSNQACGDCYDCQYNWGANPQTTKAVRLRIRELKRELKELHNYTREDYEYLEAKAIKLQRKYCPPSERLKEYGARYICGSCLDCIHSALTSPRHLRKVVFKLMDLREVENRLKQLNFH